MLVCEKASEGVIKSRPIILEKNLVFIFLNINQEQGANSTVLVLAFFITSLRRHYPEQVKWV